MNHDDVDFTMIGQQCLGSAGRIVAARYNEPTGIARLNQSRQTKKLLRSGLKTYGQPNNSSMLSGIGN
jgi:hypothetical protein